jgi:hypothetical protein
MNKFKSGDIVYLKQEAIKYFYGTEECIRAFERPYVGFGSREFVEFVHYQIGFESGEKEGIVIGKGYSDAVRVYFFSPILGWTSAYYDPEDLKLVKKSRSVL